MTGVVRGRLVVGCSSSGIQSGLFDARPPNRQFSLVLRERDAIHMKTIAQLAGRHSCALVLERLSGLGESCQQSGFPSARRMHYAALAKSGGSFREARMVRRTSFAASHATFWRGDARMIA
ncbi:MAG: hypothetical protein RIC55_25475 [Pirellulaceae bacterium]